MLRASIYAKTPCCMCSTWERTIDRSGRRPESRALPRPRSQRVPRIAAAHGLSRSAGMDLAKKTLRNGGGDRRICERWSRGGPGVLRASKARMASSVAAAHSMPESRAPERSGRRQSRHPPCYPLGLRTAPESGRLYDRPIEPGFSRITSWTDRLPAPSNADKDWRKGV